MARHGGDAEFLILVSSHTRPRGRVMPVGGEPRASLKRVSIHTRPRGRVMPPLRGRRPHHPRCFNPHPPSRAGDAGYVFFSIGTGGTRFNPHPPSRAGDASGQAQFGHGQLVSLHTRPRGRVMRPWFPPARAARYRFNPHPPSRAGDARVPVLSMPTFSVSIHTRPRGRVMHAIDGLVAWGPPVSIHTRPRGRVMHRGIVPSEYQAKFQSTPALAGG